MSNLLRTILAPNAPLPPEHPAFVVTTSVVIMFEVDEDALGPWIADKQDGPDLPTRVGEYPAFALSQLVAKAIKRGVIVGDSRLELTVAECDEPERPSGYFVLVGNRIGDQCQVQLTSGWTEIWFPDTLPCAPIEDDDDPTEDDDDPTEAIREYLAAICTQANRLLLPDRPTST